MRQCDRGQHAGMQRQDSFAMQDDYDAEDDDESLHPSGKSESEEEDYESFFLQPASCPYNIKEKIAEANAQLFQEGMNESKAIRVQFRSDLVDFEPDLTDDDVQSIESYTEEVINVNEELKYVLDTKLCNIMEEEIIEESIFETIIELNHQQQCAEEAEEDEYSTPEETEEIEEVENVEEIEEVDEIEEIEEIKNLSEDLSEDLDDIDLDVDGMIEEFPEVPAEIPTPSEIERLKSLSISQETDSESFNLKQSKGKPSKSVKKRRLPHEINCKKHCIEELDSRLDLCISNLRLNEKITKPLCPTLRLHRQKCCSSGCKIEQKLPLYTGAHSEYGLSSAQIDRLAKHKQTVRLKEERARDLSEAYRQRRIQQNEIIFRQWLKDIAERRHAERAREKAIISGTSRTISRMDTTRVGPKEIHEKQLPAGKRQKASKARPRPKTANCITSLQLSIVSEAGRKRRTRPHTTSSSTARIYIEIPERMLDDGFSLGDLFIKQLDSKNPTTEKPKSRLHISTRTGPCPEYTDK